MEIAKNNENKNGNIYINRFSHLPVAFTGLALGIGGLGNCILQLGAINGYNSKWITIISVSIVCIFLIMMLIKNIAHPKVLKSELEDPLLVSLLPTFSMSLMIVAGFIGMWNKSSKTSPNQIAAAVVMCLAVAIQFVLIGFFIKSFIKNHIKSKNQHMYGTYFVPIVGLITACTVAGNVISLPNIFFQVIWFIGYGTFVLTLPVVTYSLLFKEQKVSAAQFPSIAVWFAPANLSCAGFLQVFMLYGKQTSLYPSAFLYTIFILTVLVGFCTSLLLYLFIFRIFMLRWKNHVKDFAPILCSLSFPCAIGSTSMVWTAKKLANMFYHGMDKWYLAPNDGTLQSTAVWFFGIVGIIFATLTTIVIGYLLFNMIRLAIVTLFTKRNDDKMHSAYKK